MASASLMMEVLEEKSVTEANILFFQFHNLVTGIKQDTSHVGKLAVLAGVVKFPIRVKCATLCWHTALAALHHNTETLVKTE